MHRNRISGGWLLAALLLTGCASMKSLWPFGAGLDKGPPQVAELELQSPASGSPPGILQFWERNTLVLDLQNVTAAGQVVVKRRGHNSWPARIAVRMAPQRFEVLEVRGAQRVVMPVASGTGAVTAELPSGTYDQSTAALTISWGARGAF